MGRDRSVLKKCSAPQTLVLKEGAPVILVKNMFHLSNSLVNGLSGVVASVSPAGPVISFEDGCTYCIKLCDFPMFSSSGALLATRKQLPLQLGFSMTIHKSQGMSIPRLQVCLRDCFEAGQLYVALSRATSLAGLQVLPDFSLNFPRVSSEVSSFYQSKVCSSDNMSFPTCSKQSLPLSQSSFADVPPSENVASDDFTSTIQDYPLPPPLREEIKLPIIVKSILANSLNGPQLTLFLQDIGLHNSSQSQPTPVLEFFAFCINYMDNFLPISAKFQFKFVQFLNLSETTVRWKKVVALSSSCFPGDVTRSGLWLCVRESFNYLIGLAAAATTRLSMPWVIYA